MSGTGSTSPSANLSAHGGDEAPSRALPLEAHRQRVQRLVPDCVRDRTHTNLPEILLAGTDRARISGIEVPEFQEPTNLKSKTQRKVLIREGK